MLLKITKKRRLTALLALPACALIVLRKHIVPVHSPRDLSNAATARAAGLPQSLSEALAAAKREGFCLTAQDLQSPLPPPEQNAAPIYMQMSRASTGDLNPQFDTPEMPEEGLPSEAQFAALRKTLAEYSNVDRLDAIHRAAARSQCVFVRDWSQPSGVLFPEYDYMKCSVGWLTAESLLLLHDGKPLEAVRVQALGFAIARHAAQEPIPFAYFVACSIHTSTLRGLRNILLVAGADAAVANAVCAVVQQNRAEFSLAHGMHGYLATLVLNMEILRKSSSEELRALYAPPALQNPTTRAAMVDYSELATIQLMRRLVAASQRPYLEARDAVEAALTPAAPPGDPGLMPISAWPFRSAPERMAWLRTQEASVYTASALLACKATQGAFPNDLQAALTPVPADPFGTGALGYRREGAGFVLYSVGKTGKYDGKGEPDSSNQETRVCYPLNAAPNNVK